MSPKRARERTVDHQLTPGQHLRAEIERLGLDQVAVCKATGVSRQTINNIVNDRQVISRAMAGKLARITARGSDYWLRASYPFTHADDDATAAMSALPAGDRVLVDYQIVDAVRNGIVGLRPFNEANVRPASFDLTLGNVVTTIEGKDVDVSGSKGFLLERNSAVAATTRERIALPRDYLGRVGLVPSLAKIGILTSTVLQIAPGFGGYLQFCIFNSGADMIELRCGMPLINIEIVRLSVVPALNGINGGRSLGANAADRPKPSRATK